MTPDDVGRMCMAWVLGDVAGPGDIDISSASVASAWTGRRVVCVEPDGPRRTWVLYEGGRQVGHARLRLDTMRAEPVGSAYSVGLTWTVEASDRTRAMLGLEGT